MTKRGTAVAVDYRVQLENGTRWRVYDLVVEGVSFVGNYRAQFNAIIGRSPYQELVKKLKAPVEK